jgi:hypothetical protein
MPNLSNHDLKQMDDAWQDRQPEPVVRELLKRTMNDLRAARDFMNQSPANSSRPSGSMPPWQRSAMAAEHAHEEECELDAERADESDEAAASSAQQPEEAGPAGQEAPEAAAREQTKPAPPRRPGRRVGAPGHGREQKLLPIHSEEHRPPCCAACELPLPSDGEAQAWTGWDTLEMVPLSAADPAAANVLGVRIECTRHLLMQQCCADCGHTTRAQATRATEDALWSGVDISQQRLLGPRLAAVIVYLCQRMRLPRRKVSELMLVLLGLQLSSALIDQTVHQAARSVAPLEDELTQQLEKAVLVYADETSWAESAKALWLWVVCCCHTVHYLIGARTKELFDSALNMSFTGTLMSDGYAAYRARLLRLRCWGHLLRKLKGVAESTDHIAAHAGAAMRGLFEQLMLAVFEAREHLAQPPPAAAAPPAVSHAHVVTQLRQFCEQHRDSPHQKLRSIAREFLNDWDVIMRPLQDPRLPLTNNAAERQLRHYVIARRISYGTRTAVGSHSMALLASVIDTCRLRRACPIDLLARAIHAARMGLPAPTLPPIPADLLSPAGA